MPARRRLVQICVGFIGIAFIGLVAHFALKFTYREARIAHQPVTHWLELLSSDNEQDRTNAQRALRSELAPTMEYVFKELDAIEARDYHEGVVKNLSLLLSGSSIEQERGQRRWTAFTLLDGLGPLATNAIPRAVDWLKDDRLDGIAIDILASIGEPAEPVVLNLLENPNQDLRRKAVRALSHFKPTSDRILGAIIESTMDKDARIQTAAIGALWLSDAPPEVKGRILGDLL